MSHLKRGLIKYTGSLILLSFFSFSPSVFAETLTESFHKSANSLFYLLATTQNPLVSPFSINSCLLMTSMGAKGTTLSQIRGALQLTIPQNEVSTIYADLFRNLFSKMSGESAHELIMASGLWVDNTTTILPAFRNLVQSKYYGQTKSLNFQNPSEAAKIINNWVQKNTGNNIVDFIDPKTLSNTTKILLTNTLFFRGKWTHPFESQKTASQKFTTNTNTLISVPMMSQTNTFPYFENEKGQVLAIPIQGEANQARIAFLIFLPKKGVTKTPFEYYYMEMQEKKEGYLSYIDDLQEKMVAVTIPKFTLSQRLNLNSLMNSRGIVQAFTPNADFSGIDGKKDLQITEALHEATLSIDETGIFAVAGSEIALNLKAMRQPESSIPFVADHPFLYLLVDLNTKLILFMGTYDVPPIAKAASHKEGL